MDIHVLSDPELLKLAQHFDPQALAQIYDAYSPGLYRYAMRLLGDQNQAEDCVAETFSRFLQALQAKRGPESFLQAYLFRVAHNWIVDQYRRESIMPVELTEDHQDKNADPEKDAGHHLGQENLRMAIKTLTPDQQQVIALKYLEGWDNEEIAHSVKKQLVRLNRYNIALWQYCDASWKMRILDEKQYRDGPENRTSIGKAPVCFMARFKCCGTRKIKFFKTGRDDPRSRIPEAGRPS